MSGWKWFDDFESEAMAGGDRERARLRDISRAGFDERESDPDRSVALFSEGRGLADQLEEPWWTLAFDHWRVWALLYWKRDYHSALPLAVRNVLEIRKPEYAQFPRRLNIYDDLICTYLGIDAAGHADLIRQSMDYFEAEITPEQEWCRYHLLADRSEFALELDRLDEAQEAAMLWLARADADPETYRAAHWLSLAYRDLCEVAYRRGDWDRLADWAAAGEEASRSISRHQCELSEFLAWQALLARRDQDEARAQRLYRSATSRMARLLIQPTSRYYDVLCAFQELGGKPASAWRLRDRELKAISGKGQLTYECRLRVKRCRLLAQLGKPLGEELAAARAAALSLRQPEKYLEELEQIARGASAAGA